MNYKLNVQEVVKIVVFISGLLGTWYSMKYSVDSLEVKVEKLEKQLEETNLGVTKNDIEYIKKQQTELKDDLQDYFTVVNRFIMEHRD